MTVEQAFDEQFGTDGPESDSDSNGRGAGCDDCSRNIKLRAEHRRFVIQAVAAVRAEEQAQREALVTALKEHLEVFDSIRGLTLVDDCDDLCGNSWCAELGCMAMKRDKARAALAGEVNG